MAETPLLAVHGLCKRFGAVQALTDVDLRIGEGEVVAVVGDSGAGKSTLVKALCGVDPADSGTFEWQGSPVPVTTPQDAYRLGIAAVHQDLMLCDNLDVVQNLYLGRELHRFGLCLAETEMERRSGALLESLSIRMPSLRLPVASLSGGQRQSLAIARAVLDMPKVLILDEPTAALGADQTAQVLALIERLRRSGIGVLLISHNLEEVRSVSDRVAVLRLGRNAGLFEVRYSTEEQITSAATGSDAIAIALQRRLLPRGLPEQDALDVAHRYLPAHAAVGGDWFDVIPLPGSRVALVVGDVVGHGLHAAATMGRLRTAVQNFSSLDLAPDELLARLDELVGRIDDVEAATGGEPPIIGATCLYAVYDPVSGACELARAGHPPPAVVGPDRRVRFLDPPECPPLGLGNVPFRSESLLLPEGSELVLYTDGLIELRDRDIDVGLDLLAEVCAHPYASPADACDAVLDALLPDQPDDDVTLMIARTKRLPADHVAEWVVPAAAEAVAGIRQAAVEQLARWKLDALAFNTELILSELLTNAVRHAGEPIGVRMLLGRSLVCEVSDGSSTSPHLRYAATMDEGGRGLFIVAQLATRWGTRYTFNGKVIWAEQAIPASAAAAPSAPVG